ncbi:MAG: carboxypeptidase-like regulatory domain-containing protein [Mucilaginibacter sp.]|jgi:hypothetical protein|uniref:carboxypeptidase-like regulatory domain-containing protein n=1 Tax=Mucilaginibacter sp. TaxID=1882438 RepID=UPI003569EDB0
MKPYYLILFILPGLLQGPRAIAQSLAGTVRHAADKRPVAGASITLAGTAYGTLSRADGHYRLNAPAGDYTLRVSFVGMQTAEQTIRLPLRDTLLTELSPSGHTLSEVTISTDQRGDRFCRDA